MKIIFSSLIVSIFYMELFSQITITVDPTTQYQVMFGMGGAGTGDTSYIGCLVDNMGITAFRYYMDGDWAGDSITVADINNGNLIFQTSGDASFFQKLKSKGVTHIISTCWSPPACLKKNGCIAQYWDGQCGGSPCGTYNCADTTNYLLEKYYSTYGKFLAAYVKDFNTVTGQTLYALNIQNEPDFDEPYASALLYAPQYGPVLQAVRAQFTNDTVKNTKFFGAEDMGEWILYNLSDPQRDYLDAVLNSPTYGPLLDIFAVHGYLDGITPDLGSASGWNDFYQAVCVNNHKPLFMSETDWSGQSSDWATLLGDHSQIFSALKYGKVSAWIYWGMGSFYDGSPTIQMYVAKHYMRFIRPGYKQINVTQNNDSIQALGFMDTTTHDYSFVIVNLNPTTKQFTFNNFLNQPDSFNMYRSSRIENCGYVGKFSGNTFSIPDSSVVTLCYNAAELDWQWGPSVPGKITVTNISENAITITWTATPSWILHSPNGNQTISIIGYSVFEDGIKATANSGPTTQHTWIFTGLTPGTIYTLGVTARDALLNESALGQVVVKTLCSGKCPISVIDEINPTISVSPNPASENITLNLPDGDLYSVSLISITGQIVLEKQNVSNHELLNISGLTKGIYIVMIKNENKIYKTKLAVE